MSRFSVIKYTKFLSRIIRGTASVKINKAICDGAVVFLPDGACSETIQNTVPFLNSAITNIEDWFAYLEDYGEKAGYLAMRTMKASAWAIAAFENMESSAKWTMDLSITDATEGSLSARCTWGKEPEVPGMSRAGPQPASSKQDQTIIFSGYHLMKRSGLFGSSFGKSKVVITDQDGKVREDINSGASTATSTSSTSFHSK